MLDSESRLPTYCVADVSRSPNSPETTACVWTGPGGAASRAPWGCRLAVTESGLLLRPPLCPRVTVTGEATGLPNYLPKLGAVPMSNARTAKQHLIQSRSPIQNNQHVFPPSPLLQTIAARGSLYIHFRFCLAPPAWLRTINASGSISISNINCRHGDTKLTAAGFRSSHCYDYNCTAYCGLRADWGSLVLSSKD